jgi:hypothetical protein
VVTKENVMRVKGKIEVNAQVSQDIEINNGSSGGSYTVDWRVGNKQAITVTGTPSILTFIDPLGPCNTIFKLTQGSGGTKTITWPISVKWVGTVIPTLSTTAGKIDIVGFYFDGTYYYGTLSPNFG